MAWPLRVLGGLGITVGVGIALLSLLNAAEDQPDVLGLPFNTYLTLFGIFVILFGVLQIFLARSVRRHAQWAYAVVMLISVFWFISSLLGLYLPASSDGTAAGSATFSAWIYFLMALGAAALLLTSFVRREVEEPPRVETSPRIDRPPLVDFSGEQQPVETSPRIDRPPLVGFSRQQQPVETSPRIDRPPLVNFSRDQQAAAMPSPIEQAPARPAVRTRLDTDLPFLTFLAVVPMRVYGIFAVVLGILIVVVGLLSGSAGSLGVARAPVNIAIVMAFGVVVSLYGVFLNFLASRVGRHVRWAYIVAVLIFLLDSVPRLLGAKPEFASDVVYTVWLTSAWVSFVTGVCVATLLLTSFVVESAE